MKKVMVFGAFDLLHPGHLRFFKDAKEYGDYLVVVVGRDSTILAIKEKPPKYDEKERVSHLKKVDTIEKAKTSPP